MYDGFVILYHFLIPPKKKEERKEKDEAKPVLNQFFVLPKNYPPSNHID